MPKNSNYQAINTHFREVIYLFFIGKNTYKLLRNGTDISS